MLGYIMIRDTDGIYIYQSLRNKRQKIILQTIPLDYNIVSLDYNLSVLAIKIKTGVSLSTHRIKVTLQSP